MSSCIINVDQDLDEPWPIEVYSHEGKAYNVTMQPGDMVLYESHTVLHGRPFPLRGRHFVSDTHRSLRLLGSLPLLSVIFCRFTLTHFPLFCDAAISY